MNQNTLWFVCPSGIATQSTKRYKKEWYAIIRPLEKRMKMKLVYFDPDIWLCRKVKGSVEQYDFPLWIVEKILKKKIRRK
jgi:hypothetical protein